METDDILTDDMHVSRPVFAEVFALYFLVGVVTEGGDIVGERVKPYVYNVLWVKSNGNTPCEARSRNAEILKTGL